MCPQSQVLPSFTPTRNRCPLYGNEVDRSRMSMMFSCVSSGRARTASASRTDTAPRRCLPQPPRDAGVSRERRPAPRAPGTRVRVPSGAFGPDSKQLFGFTPTLAACRWTFDRHCWPFVRHWLVVRIVVAGAEQSPGNLRLRLFPGSRTAPCMPSVGHGSPELKPPFASDRCSVGPCVRFRRRGGSPGTAAVARPPVGRLRAHRCR